MTNEEFVKCLRDNEILIWGADIRSKEGYQSKFIVTLCFHANHGAVSQTLQTTTYPALSFFSLMPIGSSSGSSSSNSKFTILTTVQGSPSTTTSAPALIQLITNTIIPRTRPFLNRLRRERQALEESRRVREEQDRILAETERRDRDKILAIRRENETRARREREAEESARAAEEAERMERERSERLKRDMRAWRGYAKRHLLPREATAEEVKAKTAIRVQIRLPQGMAAGRNVRAISLDSTARDVYIWAETLLLDDDEGDASLPPGFSADYPPRADMPHLTLYTAYPRQEVSIDAHGWQVIRDAGASLVMELAPGEKDKDEDSEGEAEDSD